MRATPLALAATCASAVLLLSACGGGSKDDGAKITDAASGTPNSSPATTSAAPAPSASATGVARPTITLPSDVKDVFEGGKTGDPVKDAILADNQGFVMAVDDGVVKGSGTTDAVVFYSSGKGLTNSITYINGFVDKGITLSGTVRYFDRKVTLLSDGQAALLYCSDESKAFPKNRKTGKVDRSSSSDDKSRHYVFYNTDLKKNAQGVWQTDNITSIRGGKQCVP